MSRTLSAQARSFSIAEPYWAGVRQIIATRLPNTQLLRRTVPVLIAIFAALAAVGLVVQTLKARQFTFDLAEERLGLMADISALRLKDAALTADSDWQGALAASLAKGATLDD